MTSRSTNQNVPNGHHWEQSGNTRGTDVQSIGEAVLATSVGVPLEGNQL